MTDKRLRLSIILDALDRATGPMRSATAQADKLGKAFRATRDRVRALGAAQRDMASHGQLRERLVADTLALTQARRRADELKTAFQQAETPTAKLTREFTRARDEVQRLERAQGEHRDGLREVETRLEAAGVDTRRLAEEEARLRRETDTATGELNQQRDALARLGREQRRVAEAQAQYQRSRDLASNMQSTGQSAVVAGVAIAAPVVAAGREAVNLESAMAGIRKVVDFESPQQFDQMRRDILDLSTELPIASEGIAQIIAAAGQANIPRAELMGFARDAAMMGVAFDTTPDEAGAMMATWRTAFRMGGPAVRTLADQINYLGNNSAAGVDKVSAIVTSVGPLGEVGGVAAAEIAALGATMAAVGVDSDRAGTGIQNLILGLTRGEAATLRQRQGFEALGLDAQVMARRMQDDAAGAITEVMTRLGGLDEHRQAAVLSNLFGRESIGAIAPLLTNVDLLQEHLRMVGDASRYAGSMEAEFISVNDTAGSSLTRIVSAARAVGNQFGQQLLPIIKAVGNVFIEKTIALRRFAEAHPGVIKVVGGLLMALSAVLIAFGALAMIVAAVLGPFALMRLSLILAGPMFKALAFGVWGAVRAFSAFTLALLANPITWIVLAVLALAAAAYLIYRNWGSIGPWLAGVWDGIKSVVGGALAWIINAFMTFTPLGHLITAFAVIWRWFPTVRDRFLSFGGDLIQGMIDGVLGGMGRLLAAVMRVGGRIINGFKDRLGIRSPSRVFAALGVDTVQGLIQGVDRTLPDARAAMGRLGGGMAAAMAIAGPGAAEVPDSDARAFMHRLGGDAATMAVAGPRAVNVPGEGRAMTPGAPGAGGITVNVYPAPGQDASAIAEEVMRRIEDHGRRAALSAYQDDGYGE